MKDLEIMAWVCVSLPAVGYLMYLDWRVALPMYCLWCCQEILMRKRWKI